LRAEKPAVSGLLRAHRAHLATLHETERVLHALGARATFRHRNRHGGAERFDLVITLGGDGTLLWASQSIGRDQPVIAVNSAPQDSVGFFCSAQRTGLSDALADALAGRLPEVVLTRMRVDLDGVVRNNRILNDALFSHYSPAATTRYAIRLRGREEEHKSSGVWVATAAGSTAAIRSAGGTTLPLRSKRLQFLVREPYVHGRKRPALERGFLAEGETLELESRMRAGRLYLDGPHIVHSVPFGSSMSFTRSDEPLTLLGLRKGHRA